MTAKYFLRGIHIMEGRIRRNRERLKALREAADGIRGIAYDGDKVQSSASDQMAERIGEIADLERETMGLIVELEKMKADCVNRIHEIGDEALEDVLFLRWVEHLDFYEIAENMNYSLRHVHRLHGEALKRLTEILAHDVI